MLESLRGMMGGFVAKLFIGLLVLSFAVWGVSGAIFGGAGTSTIEVGDTKVSMIDYRFAYQNRVNALERQFNQRLSREQSRALGLDQAVLSQLVSGAVLDESARKMGLGVSDDRLAELIADDPAFRDASGRFSRSTLDLVLRNVGMRQEDYIRNRENLAVRNQLVSALSGEIALPEALKETLGKYQSQKRVFDYVLVTPDALEDTPEPTDADLEAFYEENKQDYVAPEYRKLTLVKLTAEDIADPAGITDAEVAEEYERIKDRYSEPELRQVQQVSFSNPADAEAAAKRLEEGESFQTILTELGRTEADIDLGLLKKGDLPDQNIADAAFELELNKPSGVVTGVFGPVILRVTEIREESAKPLEEVSDEIRQGLAITKASDELYDIHDKLEDERAAGETLPQAAQIAGLTATTVEAVDSFGLAPDGSRVTEIPEASKVLAEAFDTDEGVEADPVNIGTEGFLWYEVEDVISERQKPLEEVREEVLRAWTDAETTKRVEEIANTIRDRASKGEDLAAVAGEFLAPAPAGGSPESANGQTAQLDETGEDAGDVPVQEAENTAAAQPDTASLVSSTGELTRRDTGGDLTSAAVQAGFSAAESSYLVVPGESGTSRIVMKVARVIEGDAAQTPDEVAQELDSGLADDVVGNLVTDLQSREDVRINQQAIDAAINF